MRGELGWMGRSGPRPRGSQGVFFSLISLFCFLFLFMFLYFLLTITHLGTMCGWSKKKQYAIYLTAAKMFRECLELVWDFHKLEKDLNDVLATV